MREDLGMTITSMVYQYADTFNMNLKKRQECTAITCEVIDILVKNKILEWCEACDREVVFREHSNEGIREVNAKGNPYKFKS